MSRDKINSGLFELFTTFAKIGLFMFGGGYAMLPLLERECIDTHNWVTEEELMNYFAIGQCTPGIIAINTATFIGKKERGVAGAISATLGIVFPSIVIITVLSSVIAVMSSNPLFQRAFSGIRVAVCALISSSIFKMSSKSLKSPVKVIIAVAVFALEIFAGISPVLIVIFTVLFSVSFFFIKERKGCGVK